MHISRTHILPRQVHANGLPPHHVELPDATLSVLIEGYTREAGLRNLEREIGALCRALAVRHVALPEGAPRDDAPREVLLPADLEDILGPRR